MWFWLPVMGLVVNDLQRQSPGVSPTPICTSYSTHQEGTPLLLPWSLGWPSVTECGRSDAVTITNFKKGQFLSHHVRRKSRLSCWREGHMLAVGACRFCRLQPAPSRTWLWGPRVLQPQVSLAHTMWDRDEHSSLSSAANSTSVKLQANKRIDVISHWLLGQSRR